MIAQIDEDEIAMIALAMDPARDPDSLAGVARSDLATFMGAVGVHVHLPFIFALLIAGALIE